MHFPTLPQDNPAIDQLFGLRTDHAPTPIGFSPRASFSWNIGRSPASVRPMFGPSILGALSAGIGRFVNVPGSNSLATPMAEYIIEYGTRDADAETVQKLKDTRAAILDLQFGSYRALRELLTPEQRKKTQGAALVYDRRELHEVRKGRERRAADDLLAGLTAAARSR